MTRKPKLTDLDLVLLSGAAQRADGMVLPPPATVKARGKTLEKALAKLLRLDLVEECPATAADQVWRKDEQGRGIALRIAAAGREALGIGSEPDAGAPTDAPHAAAEPAADEGGEAPGDTAPTPTVRPGTKQARLVECLSRPWGASIDDLVQALGWQPHTIRAAMTGLRKKGYVVTRAQDERGVTVYRANRQTAEADNAA